MVSANIQRNGCARKVFVPADADFSELQRPWRDPARWLVGMTLRKEALGDVDDEGYARLNAKILQRTVGHDYARQASALVERGVLAPIAKHLAGSLCRGYAISDRLSAGRVEFVELRDRGLIRRLDVEQSQMERSWQPIHYQLRETQRRHLRIIGDEAERIVDDFRPESRIGQRSLVAHVASGQHFFSVCTTRRVFNDVTGAKRKLRSAYRLDGKPLAGVDIRCAQPALLAAFMRLAGGGKVTNIIESPLVVLLSSCVEEVGGFASWDVDAPDLAAFEELVRDGALYEFLVDVCLRRGVSLEVPRLRRASGRSGGGRGRNRRRRIPETPRDVVKLLLLRDVLACAWPYPSAFREVFAEEFPTVASFVAASIRRDHSWLIRTLQRFESALVIETMAPRLVESIPIVTVHDSIYSAEDDVEQVEEVMRRTADRLGLRLAFKVERCGEHGGRSRADEVALVGCDQ